MRERSRACSVQNVHANPRSRKNKRNDTSVHIIIFANPKRHQQHQLFVSSSSSSYHHEDTIMSQQGRQNPGPIPTPKEDPLAEKRRQDSCASSQRSYNTKKAEREEKKKEERKPIEKLVVSLLALLERVLQKLEQENDETASHRRHNSISINHSKVNSLPEEQRQAILNLLLRYQESTDYNMDTLKIIAQIIERNFLFNIQDIVSVLQGFEVIHPINHSNREDSNGDVNSLPVQERLALVKFLQKYRDISDYNMVTVQFMAQMLERDQKFSLEKIISVLQAFEVVYPINHPNHADSNGDVQQRQQLQQQQQQHLHLQQQQQQQQQQREKKQQKEIERLQSEAAEQQKEIERLRNELAESKKQKWEQQM